MFKGEKNITNRLAAAAGFVRRGSRVCDVGTDHAYLPIFLCKAGIAEKALATDINLGPCERAAENVRLHKCQDKIEVRQADGLDLAADFDPTDIIICGMGGELIRDILLRSSLTRKEGVRLILQPMTKATALRKALYVNGFEIVGEALAKDDRIYQIICAEYTGNKRPISDTEALLGPVNISEKGPLFSEFVDFNIGVGSRVVEQKRLHNIPRDKETAVLNDLKKIKEEL
ncbi:MAG: SAM-dependent methyltransferase [Clostridia bacterium]|nr:SAM-dependent methyltransferase [Clostridia bacterium]